MKEEREEVSLYIDFKIVSIHLCGYEKLQIENIELLNYFGSKYFGYLSIFMLLIVLGTV